MNPLQDQPRSTHPIKPIENDSSGGSSITMTCPAEAKPGNAGTKVKREARRKVLTDDYEQELRALWGKSFRLHRHDRGVVIYFDNPKQIRDEGSRVWAKGMGEKEAAQKLVAMALAKGWKSVSFTGDPAFVMEAMRQAMAAGLEVVCSDVSQAGMLDEVRAEIFASSLTARMQPTSSLLQKLQERRQRLDREKEAPDQSDRPRYGP